MKDYVIPRQVFCHVARGEALCTNACISIFISSEMKIVHHPLVQAHSDAWVQEYQARWHFATAHDCFSHSVDPIHDLVFVVRILFESRVLSMLLLRRDWIHTLLHRHKNAEDRTSLPGQGLFSCIKSKQRSSWFHVTRPFLTQWSGSAVEGFVSYHSPYNQIYFDVHAIQNNREDGTESKWTVVYHTLYSRTVRASLL